MPFVLTFRYMIYLLDLLVWICVAKCLADRQPGPRGSSSVPVKTFNNFFDHPLGAVIFPLKTILSADPHASLVDGSYTKLNYTTLTYIHSITCMADTCTNPKILRHTIL